MPQKTKLIEKPHLRMHSVVLEILILPGFFHQSFATSIWLRELLVVPQWDKVFWRPDLKNRAMTPPIQIRKASCHLLQSRMDKHLQQCHRISLEVDGSLFEKHWRKFTLRTYSSPLKQWLVLCARFKPDTKKSEAPVAAQYLSFLFRVKLFVSATNIGESINH
nr:unnamed protein product [Callosobruchus analis]